MLDTRIALVQMKCRVGDPEANIRRMEDFLAEAVASAVDIVCFPELCVTGYNAGDTANPEAEPIPGPCTQKLVSLGKQYELVFLAGLLERASNGVVFNTQVVFGPQGISGAYCKTHVPTSEIGTWSHGGTLPVFAHQKVRYGIEICYDSHFPEVSTALAERGAELLFLPHASCGDETAEEKKSRWLRYMPARAYDNTVFLAVCNQVGENGAGRAFPGVSFVCDPLGRVMAASQSSVSEEMVIADLRAADLAAARRVPETFFRHFRRPEKYGEWLRSTRGTPEGS